MKYLQLKTGKKLSEELLSVLLIHLTELQHSPQEAFRYDCSCGNCKVIFGSPRGLWLKRKYLQLRTGKKLSEKLLCVLLIYVTELQLSPQESVH